MGIRISKYRLRSIFELSVSSMGLIDLLVVLIYMKALVTTVLQLLCVECTV